MWYFNSTTVDISLYVTSDNVPVRFIETHTSNNQTTITDYTNFTPMDIPSDIFDLPSVCLGTGLICPKGPVTDLLVYMFHTPQDYSLGNMNAADLLGDANFVCVYGPNGKYDLVSAIMVQVNATWGQYQLCNYKYCSGLNDYLVGREAPTGLTPDGGECTPNEEVGSWYSFPNNGQCADNGPVSENCTWGQVKVVKTITLQCLEELGFWDVYCAEGSFPYYEAAVVFNQAFVNDDPALGGCPNYNGTQVVGRGKVPKTSPHSRLFNKYY
eukprot:TRINITY_DN1878_c0_g1_i2.p1 TRINITY_DN1878_c0_g1~~TRINITY_DN1878_c0_g1_i2.p1  ORF type:complete len:315 (-),score=47.78 TRINITY_DN1878_c0_g1_i2:26-832(-)